MSTPDTTPTKIPEQDKVHSELDKGLIKAEHAVEDSKLRYLAYAQRIRTALWASTRYLAFTSDVGEAFRPVTSKVFTIQKLLIIFSTLYALHTRFLGVT
jgi:hypothetical protein